MAGSGSVTAGLPAAVTTALNAPACALCCVIAVVAKVATAGGTAPRLPPVAAWSPML